MTELKYGQPLKCFIYPKDERWMEPTLGFYLEGLGEEIYASVVDGSGHSSRLLLWRGQKLEELGSYYVVPESSEDIKLQNLQLQYREEQEKVRKRHYEAGRRFREAQETDEAGEQP